jgi:carbon storage regulator
MGLTITRAPSQAIRIGPDIVVTVLTVTGNQVRLLIEAPTDYVIHREEVPK